ncbi:MAG: cation-translocating P-type ATPase [Solirubrobacterales bacterium]|nr:cation-translocating P-type ATPase [Solirubrobacterales bacterium]
MGRGCLACARGGRAFAERYRQFLLEPGTLVTLASAVLLVAAIVQHPRGAISSAHGDGGTAPYIAAAVIASVYIWFSAIQGVRERDFTADIPVSIATAAAIAAGLYSAAAVVAVLLLVGGLLEEFVAARAGRALDALESLLPELVTVRRGPRDEQVALDQVLVGDRVLVRPGERIAVDGTVTNGHAAVDQAAITGESIPVDKAPGDPVFAGTLATVGALEIRATLVGAQTTLGQIRRMVADAEQQKAPVQRVLDRWAKLYTPVAIVLAAILWAATGSISSAITMLIVFCPCVMVLATPTALVASIGNAALNGSLVKRGATIEAMASVDTVLFDKTGTLTTGRPSLAAIEPLDGLTETDVLALAASAEKFSEHPIAHAVVRAATDRTIAVTDPDWFQALPGLGVRAHTLGHELLIGRPSLLAEHGLDISDRGDEHGGLTTITLAVDGQPAARIAFHDEPRPEAAATIAALRAVGIGTALITGDQTAVAQRVAGQLGIDDVQAEVLPRDKASAVRDRQDRGQRVAFVGDGVNDGPALARADVGVAMGISGTDLALETAQVALLSDDLSKLVHLLGLAHQAMRAIRQNLIFSLGVLVIAVALTIAQILHPVTGALLHELSSIPVIANSARLIRRHPA